VIVGHIMGIPVEESLPQLAPAGAAMVMAVAITGRMWLGRLKRLRRRSQTAARVVRRYSTLATRTGWHLLTAFAASFIAATWRVLVRSTRGWVR
jgi:hypothetical protein